MKKLIIIGFIALFFIAGGLFVFWKISTFFKEKSNTFFEQSEQIVQEQQLKLIVLPPSLTEDRTGFTIYSPNGSDYEVFYYNGTTNKDSAFLRWRLSDTTLLTERDHYQPPLIETRNFEKSIAPFWEAFYDSSNQVHAYPGYVEGEHGRTFVETLVVFSSKSDSFWRRQELIIE